MKSAIRNRVMVVGAALVLCGWGSVGSAQSGTESVGAREGGRVAYPMAEGEERAELRFIAGRMSEEQLAELAEVAPNVEIVVARSRAEALGLAAIAHGVDGRFATAEFVEAAPELVWVQSPSAGVDRYLGNEPLMGTDRIVLTNMRAVHGPAIADHAMAMLLTLTRNMPVHGRNQREERWGSSDSGGGVALQGRTMFVVGLGGIGAEIAQRAHGFGMRVIGSRRSDKPNAEYIEYVGKPGELLAMLGQADVVAIALPLTPETEGLFDAEAFAAMKEGAYLINIGRGRIVDTDALVGALESGHLAGACLDVTDPEPLPAGHALWGRDDVVLTPHSAGDAALTRERWWTLYKENVRRFGAGEVLLNVVDKGAGY